MPKTDTVAERPAEFHSDEQRDAYVAGLEHERSGYEARLERAKRNRQEYLTAEELADRINQVDDEIARVSGKEKPSRRGGSASKPKPAAGGAKDEAAKDAAKDDTGGAQA